MRDWLLSLVASWGYPWAISAIARRNRRDKALLAALKRYQEGGSFLSTVGAYARVSEDKSDDAIIEGVEQFIAELKTRPFKELIERYGKLFKIPDFDGDPTNDQTMADLLAKILEESLTAKED